MTRAEELALVVELACVTEDRSDREQRALLTVARKTDDELNKVKSRAQSQSRDTMNLGIVDPSELESLAGETRVLVDRQKPVALKARKRRPYADPDPMP